MKTLHKADRLKIREFVTEALNHLGGKLLHIDNNHDYVMFKITRCDIDRVEDLVNQRMGHYAYPYTSWKLDPELLAVGFEDYEE